MIQHLQPAKPFPKSPVKPKPVGLGDIVEKLVHPVAKAIHWPCLDEKDQLKPGSPCSKMRDVLNNITK